MELNKLAMYYCLVKFCFVFLVYKGKPEDDDSDSEEDEKEVSESADKDSEDVGSNKQATEEVTEQLEKLNVHEKKIPESSAAELVK